MKKLISLFTGAGGLDLGFEAAGFDTAAAVEFDSDAVETLRANRDWRVIDRDIHQVASSEILDTADLEEGEAEMLIGGPPCQPFSKAGYWSHGDTLRLDDPRAGTLAAYLRVLRDSLPKAFLLENVPGLKFKGKSEGLEQIERAIESINDSRKVSYSLSVAQLNAADYGVPQFRERVFVIGSRNGHELQFPDPTHCSVGSGRQTLLGPTLPYTNAWDALGDLDENHDAELALRGKWADLLPSIPEGENYLWHTNRGGGKPLFGWRRRYWSFLLKLAKSRPSWTIQAQPGPSIGPFHWNNRRLSKSELCRIQTFPDEYNVVGTLASAQRQIGNAVPSALAHALAMAISRQLKWEVPSQPPALHPETKATCPPPEPTASVPTKYLHLIGDHEPHPGTGKGYAAKKRAQRSRRKSGSGILPLLASSQANRS